MSPHGGHEQRPIGLLERYEVVGGIEVSHPRTEEHVYIHGRDVVARISERMVLLEYGIRLLGILLLDTVVLKYPYDHILSLEYEHASGTICGEDLFGLHGRWNDRRGIICFPGVFRAIAWTRFQTKLYQTWPTFVPVRLL